MGSIIMPGPTRRRKKMLVLIFRTWLAFLVGFLLILAAAMALGECQGFSQESKADNKKIKELFHHYCLKCHGPDGKGSMVRDKLPKIPDFAKAGWQTERSKTQLVV